MRQLVTLSLLCAFASLYTMENHQQLQQNTQAIPITNILTRIYDKQSNTQRELGILLRYPSEEFKKTDIVIVKTFFSDQGYMPTIEVKKQGILDSLTCDNINQIATGFACYYPCTKKANKKAEDITVGTIAIDEKIISSRKGNDHLRMEREAIFIEILRRKIEKNHYISI